MIQKSLKSVKIRKRVINILERWKYEILISLILIFALIVRLVFFVGFDWSDSPSYAHLAYKISSRDFRLGKGLNDFRVMMYFPVALIFKLFGINTYTATLWSLITSLGDIFIIYKIAELIFNKRAGIFSALLLSVFPIEVIYSTQLMPDVPFSFFIALSIYIFLRAERNESKILYILSGVFGGFAYLFKTTGLIVFLFFSVYIIYKRRIKLNYFYILFGLSLIFFIEGLYGFLYLHDFLARYHIVSEYYCEFFKPVKDITAFPRLMFNLGYDWKFMYWNKQLQYGFFYYFLVLSVMYFLIKRQKEVYIILIWFLIFFLYREFGFQCLNPLIPIHKLDRHLVLFNIPTTLIVSYFLDKLLQNKFLRILSIIFLIFLITTSLYYTRNNVRHLNTKTVDFDVIYDFMKSLPEKDIYADLGTITQLNFRFGYERMNSIKDIQWVKSCDGISDSYVIVDGQKPWIENRDLVSKLPECIFNPPTKWKLLKEIDSVDRSGISTDRNPKIYYVP